MSKDEWGFRYTDKPRDLTQEEAKKFHLVYFDGKIMKPSFQSTGIVWGGAMTESDTYYRFYDGGTNRLVILKFISPSFNEE